VQSIEDVTGKTAFDFFPREAAERMRADDEEVLKASTPLLNREEEIANRSGKRFRVSTSKVPYRDKQSNVSGFVGITHILSQL
jgi:PAS domain S-box-containing protein